jgi:hypothetical protein
VFILILLSDLVGPVFSPGGLIRDQESVASPVINVGR